MNFARTSLTMGLCLFSSVLYALEPAIYQVKQGDTLSGIAHSHFKGPLWGAHGTVTRLIELNRENLSSSNGNLIFPGQVIRLLDDSSVPLNAPVSSSPPASSPDNDPSDVPPSPAKPLQESSSLLRTFLTFGNSRIDSQDRTSGAKATLLSDLNLELKVDVLFPLTTTNTVFIRASGAKETYQQFKDMNLNDSSQTLYGLGVGLDSQWSDACSTRVLIDQTQNLFAKATSSSDINLNKIWVPGLKGELDYRLWKTLFAEIHGGLGGAYYLATSNNNLSTDDGFGYFARLGILRQYRKTAIRGDAIVEQQSINSNYETQKRTDVKLVLSGEF